MAEELLEQNLAKYPDSAGILQTQGRLYELQKRWKEAENIFKKLLTIRPKNSLLLTHLGFSQWKLKKTEEARQKHYSCFV